MEGRGEKSLFGVTTDLELRLGREKETTREGEKMERKKCEDSEGPN